MQLLTMQKKSYQMSLDMQKKVKTQELDMKMMPLQSEKDRTEDHLSTLQDSIV